MSSGMQENVEIIKYQLEYLESEDEVTDHVTRNVEECRSFQASYI